MPKWILQKTSGDQQGVIAIANPEFKGNNFYKISIKDKIHRKSLSLKIFSFFKYKQLVLFDIFCESFEDFLLQILRLVFYNIF